MLRSARPAALRLAAASPRMVAARGMAGNTKLDGIIPENEDVSTGMELKELQKTSDIFWSREPITGPKGTRENPAIVPSFNTSRVVGLETEVGVIWFKLEKGPLHLVFDQYFKLEQIEGGDH